jgi:hypothetical protein
MYDFFAILGKNSLGEIMSIFLRGTKAASWIAVDSIYDASVPHAAPWEHTF